MQNEPQFIFIWLHSVWMLPRYPFFRAPLLCVWEYWHCGSTILHKGIPCCISGPFAPPLSSLSFYPSHISAIDPTAYAFSEFIYKIIMYQKMIEKGLQLFFPFSGETPLSSPLLSYPHFNDSTSTPQSFSIFNRVAHWRPFPQNLN